jgi:EmrB/QacA subfamily drug resistance transporter
MTSDRTRDQAASASAKTSVPHGAWVLLATILASSMAFIDGTALNVALDAIQRGLGASGAELLWIVNAYLLLLASLLLLGGSLGDHFGRNRVFGSGIALFAGASLLCGLAPTAGALIAARVVQGIGGALMIPGSLAILTANFPADKRGGAIGTWSAFSTLTTIAGPALGGVLASAGLWRAVFFINVPLAVVALAALTRVPETRDEDAPRALDYPGTVLIALGLGALTYGAIALGQSGGSEASGAGGMSAEVALAILLGGVVALAAFVVVEWRSSHPMVRLTLFRSRTFTGTNVMTFFLYGALSGVLFFLPLNLIQVQGYSALLAGLAVLPQALLLMTLSPLMGRIADRIGPRLPLTIGPALVGVGFVLLALPGVTDGPSAYWYTYLPAILTLGLGMGITVAPLTTAVMGAVPSHQAGVASGVNNAVTRSASVLALAALGALALFLFGGALQARIVGLALPPDVQQALLAGAAKLGQTPIPPGLDAATQAQLHAAVQRAFVDTFRVVTLVAAGMCFASALLAGLLVQSRPRLGISGQPSASQPAAGVAPQ